jgi:Ribosomal protein L24e
MLFLNGKARSLYFQRKKAANLAWTTTYRRLHKKDQAGEQTKRKRRNLHSKRPRAIGNLTVEVRVRARISHQHWCSRLESYSLQTCPAPCCLVAPVACAHSATFAMQEIEKRRNERPDVRQKQRELAVRCVPCVSLFVASALRRDSQLYCGAAAHANVRVHAGFMQQRAACQRVAGKCRRCSCDNACLSQRAA